MLLGPYIPDPKLQAALISCNSEIMGSNPTQGRTQGYDLNNIACALVNAESLCIPISQIQQDQAALISYRAPRQDC